MTATRTQLIATTCDLLERQGYHATGLSQILQESGSPKGSLYYHFPGGKEELALEAITQVGATVLARIRANLALYAAPAEAIRHFIRLIAASVEMSGFSSGGPISAIALETAAGYERLRLACDAVYAAWQGAFAEKLVAAGLSPARAESLAALIIAAIEGGVILCRTRRSRTPLEQVADEIGVWIGVVMAMQP